MLNFSHQYRKHVLHYGLTCLETERGLLIVKVSLVFNPNTLAAVLLFWSCPSLPAGSGGVADAGRSPQWPERWVLWGLGAECSCPEEQSGPGDV